jgi:hypothetical protein
MRERWRKSRINIAGGCIYVLFAAWRLHLVEHYSDSLAWGILGMAAALLIAAALFAKTDRPLAAVGYAMLAGLQVWTIVSCYKEGYRYTVEIGYREYYTEAFRFFTMIPDMLIVAAYLAAAICVVVFYVGERRKNHHIKKYWWLPPVLYAAARFLGIILYFGFATILDGFWYGGFYGVYPRNLLFSFLYAAFFFVAMWALAYPHGASEEGGTEVLP